MPSLRRRRILGGVASVGLGLTGAAVIGGHDLPGPLGFLGGRRPVPDVTPRPAVTADHREAAVASLEATIQRAERLWNQVEARGEAPDDLPEFGRRGRLDGARAALDEAKTDDAGWKALFDVRRGAALAGGAIGGARLALDRDDGQYLVEQIRSVRAAGEGVRGRVSYEVASPATGFAHLFWVEKRLALALLATSNEVRSLQRGSSSAEPEDVDMVTAWQSLAERRRWLEDAGRLYADYRDTLEEQPRDLRRRVVSTATGIRSAVELLQPDPAERRRRSTGATPPGPYRAIRFQLHRLRTEPSVYDPRTQGHTRGLPLYRAVRNAKTLIQLQATADVSGHLPVDERSDTLDSNEVDGARSQAVRRLRERRRATGERSLRRILLVPAEQLVRAGDDELQADADGSEPEARAWTWYRTAAEYVDRLPAVANRLDRPVEPRY